MAADSFIQCRVSAATKEALRAAAERQQLSESALVKRMIELMLHTAAPPDMTVGTSNDRPKRLARLYVRLSSGDWSLLRERAGARPPIAQGGIGRGQAIRRGAKSDRE
jgi:hypothetical protein